MDTRDALTANLDVPTLYKVLTPRVDVFVERGRHHARPDALRD